MLPENFTTGVYYSTLQPENQIVLLKQATDNDIGHAPVGHVSAVELKILMKTVACTTKVCYSIIPITLLLYVRITV